MTDNSSASILLTTPVAQWVTDRIVVAHWMDGPVSGYCLLAQPRSAFFFDLAAERHDPEGLDDRLFSLSMVDQTTFELAWSSPTSSGSHAAGGSIRTPDLASLSLPEAGASNVVVRTADMRTFLGCWSVSSWRDVPDLFVWLNL